MTLQKDKYQKILKTLGPGILFASTCIGVSHLVQSTQAGANYGFTLLWAVILANLLKYPFFEYGSRYANATGTSILDGYKKLGNWALYAYLMITVLTMFFVTAAVGKVTAGFMQNLFGIESLKATVVGLFLICGVILMIGRFKVLDSLIKIIGIVLLISTVIAFISALTIGPQGNKSLIAGDWFPEDMFVIALMGWMPTAVDLSAWNSLWTVERIKETGYHPTMKETLFDFNFGYIASTFLAICFVTLGAFLMFGTGQTFNNSPSSFSNDVINLYTKSIGNWSYIIISSAAFSIMFGTAIAIFDGYGRAMSKTFELFRPQAKKNESLHYRIVTGITIVGGLIVIFSFEGKAFGKLVNFATTLSFVVAPLIAILNTLLVRKQNIGKNAPPLWLKILSYLGILYLISFSIYILAQIF